MADSEAVVLAFVTSGETAETSVAAKRREIFSPSGDKLVGISLMAHIKDKLVVRSVEYVMRAYYEFHRSEA